MRRSCSFKYHAVCFLLKHLFLLVIISLALGSFETVSEPTCEYEDANLIWRNMPAYSFSDVKAMEWYKGKYSPIANWMASTGFVESTTYIGRLIQIGETGIKLRRANRSDSDSYWLYLTLASADNKLEAVTHIEIIVAPWSLCKPNITEEGSILKAELPSNVCGTPPLTLKWKNTSKTVIKELHNSSFLDLGRDSESGEYRVCAEGDSAKCYKGNMSDLCREHTKSQHERRDVGLTADPVSIILPIVLSTLIATAISILAVIWWKRKLSRRNRGSEGLCRTMDVNNTDINEASQLNEEYPLIEKEETSTKAEACPPNEEYPLIEIEETSRKDFIPGIPEIQNYLRSLYKDMTSVSLSPTGKENFVDVSEVYINLDFQRMEPRDSNYTETDLTWTTLYKASVSNEDIHISPIIIAGCSGSGKSTWCKHIVQCWSQNSKTEEANVQGMNLPNLGQYQILLYLPLKSSDRGLSFQDLLQNYLFQGQQDYLDIIKTYIYDKIHDQSILFLIDGFDQIVENGIPMSELLDHKLFASCTVIFTCRPSSLKLILNACNDSSIQLEVFKVNEIPLERSCAYARNVLSKFNQHNKELNVNNFMVFTRNLNVQSLLKLPYLCLTLLFVWMENKNPYIEITDILLRIVEHVLDTEATVTRCKEKIKTLSQGISREIRTSVRKLDERFVKINNLMFELSMTTEEIFLSKSKRLTKEKRLVHKTSTSGRDMLPLEVLHEIGLIYESPPLKSKESLSTLTFTNMLIYQLFVSMAIAFKKGRAFDYIVSDLEVALKHSIIIHMVWQFSPTLGKEICVEIGKLKPKHLEKLIPSEQTNRFIYSIKEKKSTVLSSNPVKWLQFLMHKGDLDDEKFLFLTNALRSMDSLTSLRLENNENNNDLVFWLPCSQTLKKLVLNIRNCTLLLCPEWNSQIPVKLKKVVIKSVIISSCDEQVLLRACKCFEKNDISPGVFSTGDNATLP